MGFRWRLYSRLLLDGGWLKPVFACCRQAQQPGFQKVGFQTQAAFKVSLKGDVQQDGIFVFVFLAELLFRISVDRRAFWKDGDMTHEQARCALHNACCGDTVKVDEGLQRRAVVILSRLACLEPAGLCKLVRYVSCDSGPGGHCGCSADLKSHQTGPDRISIWLHAVKTSSAASGEPTFSRCNC